MLTKITDADMEGKGVTPLPDVPALDSETMKYKFEEILRDVVIPLINANADATADREEATTMINTAIDTYVIAVYDADKAVSTAGGIVAYVDSRKGEIQQMIDISITDEVMKVLDAEGAVKTAGGIVAYVDSRKPEVQKMIDDTMIDIGAGDMAGATYDPDGSVAAAGGIPTFAKGLADTAQTNATNAAAAALKPLSDAYTAATVADMVVMCTAAMSGANCLITHPTITPTQFCFVAPAAYASTMTFQFQVGAAAAEGLSVVGIDGQALFDGAWAAGAVVTLKRSGTSAFFKSGGGAVRGIIPATAASTAELPASGSDGQIIILGPVEGEAYLARNAPTGSNLVVNKIWLTRDPAGPHYTVSNKGVKYAFSAIQQWDGSAWVTPSGYVFNNGVWVPFHNDIVWFNAANSMYVDSSQTISKGLVSHLDGDGDTTKNYWRRSSHNNSGNGSGTIRPGFDLTKYRTLELEYSLYVRSGNYGDSALSLASDVDGVENVKIDSARRNKGVNRVTERTTINFDITALTGTYYMIASASTPSVGDSNATLYHATLKP